MMELTPRRHELLSVMLLGIGTLFMYLGYHTQSFISEAIIHSVHSQDPGRIPAYAGYYGQALHYTAFAVSSLFTASLQHYLASKWILVLATVLFAIYHLGFLYINTYYFYFSQIAMGLAYSLYNNGEGAYLAEHSSRRTIESNTGLETAVGHTSMFVGGLCLIAIFYFVPSEVATHASNFRIYSEIHIKAIYGTFFALSMVGVIIFAFLPRKQQYDSMACNAPRIVPRATEQAKRLLKTLANPNMILLAITFSYMGLLVSFWLGIYPTTLSFTSTLSGDTYIVALYSVFAGLAELSGGLLIRPIMKCFKNAKLLTTMIIHIIMMIMGLTAIYLSVPNRATIEPTSDASIYLTPSRLWACVIGYLMGMADFTITMARAVICQIAVPDARMEAFSLTRVFQSLAACIVLFISPHMSVLAWIVTLSIGLVIGSTTFLIVVYRTNRKSIAPMDSKNDEDNFAEQNAQGISVL